ncbi:MAG TPA: NnrU family protein [Sphingomicrobium sp.]|nr:NnrU family protein [Sphingomicrobium sp.]
MTLQEGLLFSALAFIGTHFLLSHPLRAPLVRLVGEKPFRGIYSVVALVTFGSMAYFYHAIGREPPLWAVNDLVWLAGTLLMWLASILFIGSFINNPALPGAPGPKGAPKGVFILTRHPMMWSFALWAGVHLAVVAMPKALVLDGAILILAIGGAAGQDSKKSRLMGEAWHQWTAETAFIPFTRGVAWPGTIAVVGGTVLFFLATWLHPVGAGFWRWIG